MKFVTLLLTVIMSLPATAVDRNDIIQAVLADNEQLEASMVTNQNIIAQIEIQKKKIQNRASTSSNIRLTVSIAAFAGLVFSNIALKDKVPPAWAKITQRISLIGGAVTLAGTTLFIDIQEDKLQELSVLLTAEQKTLNSQLAINELALQGHG